MPDDGRRALVTLVSASGRDYHDREVVAGAAGGSRHAGGMNILMGDGSVRLV